MLSSNKIVAFVPTRDSAKARSFYEGVLGLRFVKDDGFALVLDANGIMIRVAKAPEFTPAPFTILGWQVSEIEKVVAALQDILREADADRKWRLGRLIGRRLSANGRNNRESGSKP